MSRGLVCDQDPHLVTEHGLVLPVQLEQVGGVGAVDDGLELALKRTLPPHVVEEAAVELQVDEVVFCPDWN